VPSTCRAGCGLTGVNGTSSLAAIPTMSAEHSPSSRRTRITFSLVALLALIFLAAICRSNWDRVSVREYEMSVAFDGKAPWGNVGPESDGELAPTVLYRKLGKSYCYTAFQSPGLSSRLKESGRSQINVEYNIFSSFGHEGRHTLRSVNGVLLADGKRIVENVHEFGGQILLDRDEPSSCP
jgi:hypothetical protein